MPKPKSKQGRSRKRAGPANGLPFLEALAVDAFGRAFHSHVAELTCELLRDPGHERWMREWAEGFLGAMLQGLRKKGRKKPGRKR